MKLARWDTDPNILIWAHTNFGSPGCQPIQYRSWTVIKHVLYVLSFKLLLILAAWRKISSSPEILHGQRDCALGFGVFFYSTGRVGWPVKNASKGLSDDLVRSASRKKSMLVPP
jgi:hypothetical protein